jgi:hypothetical protein
MRLQTSPTSLRMITAVSYSEADVHGFALALLRALLAE